MLMYTRGFCGYCAAARRLLADRGVEFKEIDVTMDAGARREMMERSGRRTVPQIFVGDHHVGGYDELKALDLSGELDALLAPGE